MTANTKIADGIQAHSIDLERFSVDLQNRILPVLDRLERSLTAEVAEIDPTAGTTPTNKQKRLKALLEQTRGTISTSYQSIKKTVGDDLQDIAKLSDTAGRKIVNDAVGVEIMTVAIAPEQLRALADGTLVQGAIVKEHWDRQSEDLRRKFQDRVQDGFLRGEPSTEIINRVRGTKARNYDDGIMKTSKMAASTLVRTSVQTVANDARLEVFRANGDSIKYLQHLSTLDNKTSVSCRARSMLMWDLEGNPVGHGISFNPPPIHFNCVVSGTLVSSRTPVKTLMKRAFNGEVYRITTASNNTLTCTPNHPILTQRGWVAANLIDIGSKVISDRRSHRISIVNGDAYDVPTRVEDIAEAFFGSPQVFPMPVPVASVDFHGDGVGSQVAIVGADRGLMDGFDPPFSKHCLEFEFSRAGSHSDCSHASLGLLAKGLKTSRAPTDGIMCLGSESKSFLGGRSVHPSFLLCTAVSQGDSLPLKKGFYGSGATANMVGDTCNPNPTFIETHNFNFVEDRPRMARRPEFDVSFFENPVNGLVLNPQVLSDIHGASAGEVFLDDVVMVERLPFKGHVYNLETEDNSYVANGIITHNCRSTLIPVLRPWSEVSGEMTEAINARFPKSQRDSKIEATQASMGGPVSADLNYEEWLRGQSLAMQLEVLGPAKHKLWTDGKITFRDLVDQRGNPLTLAEIIAKVESGQTTTARGETMRKAKEAAATVDDLEKKAAAAEKDVRTQVNRSVRAGHVTDTEREALKTYRETRIDGQEPPAEAAEAFDKRPEWMQDRINAAIAAKREALRAKEQAGPAAEYAKRKAVAESAQRLKSTLHDPEKVAEWIPGQVTDGELNGVPFAPWQPRDGHNWMADRGRRKIPGEAALPFIAGSAAGAIAALLEPDGRVWMYQPVVAGTAANALPFGTLESGMDAQAIALREAWEATGLQAEIVSILGDYRKPNSVMRYYIARRIGGAPWLMGHEAQSVKLVPVDQLAAITDDEVDKAAALDLAATYRKAMLARDGDLMAGLRAIMEEADDFQTAATKRRAVMLREWVTKTAKRQPPSAAAAAVYAALSADEKAAYAALAKEKADP